jgi:hypothetical protein
MNSRLLFGVLLSVGLVVGAASAWADDHDQAEPAEHHDQAEPAEHHEAEPTEHHDQAEHHETAPAEHHEAGPAEDSETGEHIVGDNEELQEGEELPWGDEVDPDDLDDDDGGVKYSKFDVDGDGKPDLDLEKEYDEAFAGISEKIDTDKVDQELDALPAGQQMLPSVTAEQFRKAVQVARKVVLGRMEKKMAHSAAKKIGRFATFVFFLSLAGFLLLAMPLFLRKKYPGKTGTLFKYSALAAVTFFVTVNLFGAVLVGLRTTQASLGSATNPSMAIASGTFDTLDRNAEHYLTMGKTLFLPTLEQLRGDSSEQPAVILLENGQKIIKTAKVFVAIAHMVKKLDWVFKLIPVVLFLLTMIFFGVAIRPTLTEIIKLPARAASGVAGVGRDVTKKAMRRVWGELLATICTIGVLVVVTLLTAAVLGTITAPALDSLLDYFSRSVAYLQWVDAPSSGLVFVTLFGVILFLVFNLAALILSSAFFLGKMQKIFQAKFNDGTPIRTHFPFIKWAIPAVLVAQLLPALYSLFADKMLMVIDDKLTSGIADPQQISWAKLMLAGPVFLVLGFVLVFWAARGIKAITFLFKYKVKPKVAPPAAPSNESAHAV